MMQVYQQHSFAADAAMALYPLVGLLFDAFLPRHRAVVATMLAGFLFLPSIQYDLVGALYWNRTTAPFFVVLLGILWRDLHLLAAFRLRWFDLPMLAWVIAPLPASITSGMGAYDGFSQTFYQFLQWGGPYLVGRLYFTDRTHLFDLARMIFLGGIIYLPLCLFEVRFSPMLHNLLYGFHQHDFVQTVRGSFYRPMVFLQHGLMAAMWMGMATLLGWSLSRARLGFRPLGVPMMAIPLVMGVSLLLMQSLGAVVLMLCAFGLIHLARLTHGKTWILIFALLPTLWSVTRATGTMPTSTITKTARAVSAARAESLEFRLDAEDRLVRHAWRRPIFGWSPSGFNRTGDAPGRHGQVVADGLWIIAFSAYGMVGLIAMLMFHFMPVWITLRAVPPWRWVQDPAALVLGVMAVMVAAISVDNILNAMINPLFLLMMGALPTVLMQPGWDAFDDEEDEEAAAPPQQPEEESTRFRRLLGDPDARA